MFRVRVHHYGLSVMCKPGGWEIILCVNEFSLFLVTLGWNTLSPILGENIPVTG